MQKEESPSLDSPLVGRLAALLNRDPTLISRLAQQHGLPLHLFFIEEMRDTANAFFSVSKKLYPNILIAFSVKSNPCRGALRIASSFGLGADVASEYELQVALEEGIPPEKIICNGNAKSDKFLQMALAAGALIAIDSSEEIKLVDEICGKSNQTARALIRFSGMPLEGFTAASQSTASAWTKFGIPIENAPATFQQMLTCRHVTFEGISAHIGTQICDPAAYDRLLDNFLKLVEEAASRGLETRYLNIGGGFPVQFLSESKWKTFTSRVREQLSGSLPVGQWVTWDNLPMGYTHLRERPERKEATAWRGKAYWSLYPTAAMLERILVHRARKEMPLHDCLTQMGSPTLIVEPGRSLMAPAGVTLARVISVKEVLGNPVVALDLGINNHGTNLIAPDIFPVSVWPKKEDDRPSEAFLAGRLCFSGDMISRAKVSLNRLPRRGELLVIYGTGAYSADHFASHSCGFPRPAKLAVHTDGSVEVWRRPETFEDVFGPKKQ
jgi:diaminopimelate decarboxylase